MKTKNEARTDKTVIDQLREIRDTVSLEIQDMTMEQLKEYLDDKKTLHPTAVWQKID